MRLLPVLAILCLIVWGFPSEARSGFRTAQTNARSAFSADTLSYSVTAGQPLIVQLPREVGGRSASYRLLRGPALSWLVDRSFLWRTLASEAGTMHVLVEQRAAGLEPDTLVLAIRVGP